MRKTYSACSSANVSKITHLLLRYLTSFGLAVADAGAHYLFAAKHPAAKSPLIQGWPFPDLVLNGGRRRASWQMLSLLTHLFGFLATITTKYMTMDKINQYVGWHMKNVQLYVFFFFSFSLSPIPLI